jgi:hypothetical protein
VATQTPSLRHRVSFFSRVVHGNTVSITDRVVSNGTNTDNEGGGCEAMFDFGNAMVLGDVSLTELVVEFNP